MTDSEPAARAPTAGELLRAARERQGIHIAALAAAIKVTPRKLDALENDRWSELPDSTFVRALAQTVCRSLKIDAGPVLALLPATVPISLEPTGNAHNQPFHDRPGRGDGGFAAGAIRPMLWAAGVLMVAAVVVYFVPADLLTPASVAESTPDSVATSPTPPPLELLAADAEQGRAQPSGVAGLAPVASDVQASETAPAQSMPPQLGSAAPVAAPLMPVMPLPATEPPPTRVSPSGLPPASLPLSALPLSATAPAAASPSVVPAAPTQSSTAPVLAAAAPSTQPAPVAALPAARPVTSPVTLPQPVPPAASTSGNLQLSSTAPSWVEVRDARGELLLSRTLLPGENVGLDGALPLRLTIGNAAATRIAFRGQPVDLASRTRDNVARLEVQ